MNEIIKDKKTSDTEKEVYEAVVQLPSDLPKDEFLKKLNDDKQIVKSITIADSIEDEPTKSKTKAQIALHIVGIEKRTDD